MLSFRNEYKEKRTEQIKLAILLHNIPFSVRLCVTKGNLFPAHFHF